VRKISNSQLQIRKFKITGRVQGVFFRDSTKRVADSLSITGHAINLGDGSVEVLACGNSAAIQSLQEWLQEGPPMASVSAVLDQSHAQENVEKNELRSFRTG
jgi:acylphosphatase